MRNSNRVGFIVYVFFVLMELMREFPGEGAAGNYSKWGLSFDDWNRKVMGFRSGRLYVGLAC